MVLLNIGLFLFFIHGAFQPRTKTDWKTFGSFSAFIVALFAEMYGFPLTIYLLTSYVGNRFFKLDFTHSSGHLLNTIFGIKGDPHLSIFHIASYVFIFGGLMLLSDAWKVLYNAQKQHVLATTGPYLYIRHPQYVAFVLVILGFLLQWPTIITLLMAPILIFRYIRLAVIEEKEVSKQFGKSFQVYKQKTPAYLPSIRTIYEKLRTMNKQPSPVKEQKVS